MNRLERFALVALLVVAGMVAYMVPSSAQVASRMFATLSTNLTSGASTPITCTASGAGCYLDISIAGGTITPNAVCLDSTNQDVCWSRASAGAMSMSLGTTVLFPDGTSAAPGISFRDQTSVGFLRVSSGTVGYIVSAAVQLLFQTNKLGFGSGGILGWTSVADASGAASDTGLSRLASSSLALGQGTAGAFNGTLKLGNTNSVNTYQVNGVTTIAGTAPTISSGFGTSPSIASSNGTAAFTINVGTGGTASSGVIGFPTATTGWSVNCADVTTQNATVYLTKQTAVSTTTATIGNFDAAGAAGAWVASNILVCHALAY